jgi:isopenicillin N synthase-like dioxygenase
MIGRSSDAICCRYSTLTSDRTFTILFQDTTGGLELRDPQTGEFIHADPKDGTLVLNVGDMLGRFTNGKSLRSRPL